jgi:hypothetical protein
MQIFFGKFIFLILMFMITSEAVSIRFSRLFVYLIGVSAP